jgi:hypothetical protein
VAHFSFAPGTSPNNVSANRDAPVDLKGRRPVTDSTDNVEPIEDMELDADDAAAVKGGFRAFQGKGAVDGHHTSADFRPSQAG